MLRKRFVLFVSIFLTGVLAFAQDGAIKGKVMDKETAEVIPFANIIAERGGKLYGGATSDFEGDYSIKPLPPGKYDIKVSFVGYKSILLTGVIVTPDAITFQDLKLASSAEELDVVEVIGYEVPLISKDKTQSGETVTRDDIASMPTRSALGVAATVGGVFQSANGDLNVRGARGSATNYYIDGVRVRGSKSIPQSAIEQVTVVTGGIPAKYGDATGGIISITTRGPSDVYYGGVELLSSGFYLGEDKDINIGLDPYAYNLLGFNVSGPLLKTWDKVDSVKRTRLGFFLAGELTHIKDGSPQGIQMYKAGESLLDSLKKTPLRPSGTGQGSFENTEYVDKGDLEAIKFRQNVTSKGMNLSGKVDVRTGPNVNLTFGGTFNWNTYRSYSFGDAIFNYDNNAQVINTTWRAYAKFTQKFNSPESSEEESSNAAVKNAFYTLHIDYTYFNQRVQDAKHKDNLFNYGYVGKFTTYRMPTYEFGTDSVTGLFGEIMNAHADTLYDFEGSDINQAASDYTQSYYDLYSDPLGNYENWGQVVEGGAIINGSRPGDETDNVYDVWTSPGRVYNGYTNTNQGQFRILASGSADIFKDHEISAGFEYEQRTDRFYGVSPVSLWTKMRQITNNHILQLDKNNPQPVYYDLTGSASTADDTIYAGRINYPYRYDGASQALFDYNLRKELGLPTDGTDWIDLNSLPPSTFDISMFSADELLNGGSSYIAYYGYDYTGKKLKSKPSLDDFFNQTSNIDGFNGPAVFDRPIGAYEPNYVAGYIQDKFAFKDLVFNIGLRIDRFDANQKVLKDPYLIFPAITAGEVRSGEDRSSLSANVPDNIGDNYVVYVDDIQDPGTVLGYRNNNTWYNSVGAEIVDAEALQTSSGVLPYLVDPDKTNSSEISSNAFVDYKPQTTFMPRIAFSFPISDEALFFAHYDVLARRPESGRFSPTDYLFMQSTSDPFISNPDLKPSQTVDYEIGFQQKLNSYSSLKIATFYREMKDEIQITRVLDAYPTSYRTLGNLDFGTIKGMTFVYDLRRMGNVRLRASYTLQFAEGTGSSSSTAANIIGAGQPNLKVISPLNWDQRHMIQTTFDYHYGKGKDYNGPIWFDKKVFEEAGVNIVVIGGSGLPYSKQRNITKEAGFTNEGGILLGSLNGSRLPWQVRMNGKLDKYFDLEWGKENKKRASLQVYLQVLNVLNTLNIVSVYGATGNPDDDGFLNDPGAQNSIESLNDEQAFRELYALKVNNPGNYTTPRRIRLGMLLNF